MDTTLVVALSTMGGLGFFFAMVLAIADKKLHVDENPLIAHLSEMLPNANCGACGNAGCHEFAVNLVEGKAMVNGCPIGGEELAGELAHILGVDAEESIKMVARVLCAGGIAEARHKDASYAGPTSCAAAMLVSGGEKLCFYGCLGGGDCVEACQVGAIYMGRNGLPVVVEQLCTGCGLCVTACPRDIIEIHPAERELFIFCKNQDDPKTARQVCAVACLGCGVCARLSPDSISMQNNLAVIDYSRLDVAQVAVEKCRTGALCLLKPPLKRYQEDLDGSAGNSSPDEDEDLEPAGWQKSL